jgi:hypothetical protein
MRSSHGVEQAMDLVTGRRVFDGCWLSASLGISMVQMHVLAQAWQVNQHALVPASVMSFWVIGALLGARVPTSPRIWASSWLACTLLWWSGSSRVSWHVSLGLVPSAWVSIAALALVAVVLGGSSTAWLSQQRAWPSEGERTALVRNLVGLTVGLVVVWLLPTQADLLALCGCLPLLVLDFLPLWHCPLPTPGGLAASWIKRYWTTDSWHLQLDERALSRNWWRTSLGDSVHPSRGDLPLMLLASGVAVMLGSVWGAVPTPFAAGLSATHTLEKLGWLLGGQLVTLAVGACFLVFAARGVIGFSDRLLPTAWQPRLRSLMLVMPLWMIGSLVALGLPILQAPWWLGLSLASYTLADAIWSLLFPRLRPDLATRVLSRRHLLPEQSVGWLDPVRLAYKRACEARTNRQRATIEGMLIAAMTPVISLVIDWRGGVDEALIIVGLIFFLSLACALGGYALFQVTSQPSRGYTRHSFHGMSSRDSVLPQMKTSPHSLKGN